MEDYEIDLLVAVHEAGHLAAACSLGCLANATLRRGRGGFCRVNHYATAQPAARLVIGYAGAAAVRVYTCGRFSELSATDRALVLEGLELLGVADPSESHPICAQARELARSIVSSNRRAIDAGARDLMRCGELSGDTMRLHLANQRHGMHRVAPIAFDDDDVMPAAAALPARGRGELFFRALAAREEARAG